VIDLVEQLLDEEEGEKPFVYPDSRGFWTIARGVCVDSRVPGAGLPRAAMDAANEIRTEEARQRAMDLPGFNRCNAVRQAVLVSMCFQLGDLHDWPHFKGALAMDDYEAAAAAGMDSDWARTQTPARAKRQMQMMASGQWVNK
jgi:GH24 family phage-related lysozyme (muramidase)